MEYSHNTDSIIKQPTTLWAWTVHKKSCYGGALIYNGLNLSKEILLPVFNKPQIYCQMCSTVILIKVHSSDVLIKFSLYEPHNCVTVTPFLIANRQNGFKVLNIIASD